MKDDDVKVINGILDAASDIVCTTSDKMRNAIDAYRAVGSPRVPDLPSAEALETAALHLDLAREKQDWTEGKAAPVITNLRAVAAFLRAMKGEG